MTELIESLSVAGFRAISDVKIEPLGRVNLVTGKNNAGKSSLLEAIRILVTGGSLRTLQEILNYREEVANAEFEKAYSNSDGYPFCSLLSGFPNIESSGNGFSISADGQIPKSLSSVAATLGWFVRNMDSDGRIISMEPTSSYLFDDPESFPALEISSFGRKRVVPLDRLIRRSSAVLRSDIEATQISCVYLDPFSSRSTSQMGALWDAIALTDAEQEVVKALRVVSSDIQAVSMIGSDHRDLRPRTAIARSKLFLNPVPLRTFGDGVNRLFGIILSLCNARNGVLLVDEIENGLHYSIQADIWRTIFRLSSELNVQVFATSHSWDCVRAFQEAASESPADGVLVRLTRQSDGVSATLFTERELEIATRDEIEVR